MLPLLLVPICATVTVSGNRLYSTYGIEERLVYLYVADVKDGATGWVG